MTQVSIDHEQVVRTAFVEGDLEAAAKATLRAYGEEIFGFICARLPNRDDAQEAFSMFLEDLWTSLHTFAWRCSMRTWAYALARNAMRRYASAPARRAERNQPLSLLGITSKFALEARSVTRMYQRTAEKDRFRALREKLDGDDQMLLILRVDRNLEWRDLAIAMSGDLDCDDETIVRESARLRKAFERLKRELRRLAVAEGLLEPRD